MSSSKTPTGLPSTPAKDASSSSPSSTKSPSNDVTPSRLEMLRAKVHNSRQKVADQKRVVEQHNNSGSSWGSSSSLSAVETQPLHAQENCDSSSTLQEWKDVVKSLEQDKESLKKELSQLKKALESAKETASSKDGDDDKAAATVWEERYQALEAINHALKEQSQRDDTTKAELSRLCESLERQLEAKVTARDDPSTLSAESSLARVSRDLREAQARESILQVELSSLQSANVQLTTTAIETQIILEKELKDSRTQYQTLSANMRELSIVEEDTPMARVGGSDLALTEQVKELQGIIDSWKHSTETEKQNVSALGDSVIRNLQGKIKTMQSVVTTQMTFRRKLERRVNELLKQVQALRKERSADKTLDHESLKRMSLQLVDANTGFAALEAQVAVLNIDLEEARAEKEEQVKLAQEKEKALQQALERNGALMTQVERLDQEIKHLKSTVSVKEDDSASEMELLMELQAVRDEIDQVTLESKKLQGLLDQEKTRSSDLTKQVEDLKKKVEQLEEAGASPEDSGSQQAQEEGPIAVLKKMKKLQDQTDQLIDQAIQTKGGNENEIASRIEIDAPMLLTELKDIRYKVHSHIEILERAQTRNANDRVRAAAAAARQRNPGEMDIRITNEITGRHTDLFVLPAQESTMYDAVYNSEAVRSSNIGRWPAEIAEASKSKAVEVQCILLDAQGNCIKAFLVKELRKCTTKDFLSLVADPFGKIKLVLRCHNVKTIESKSFKSIRVSNEVTGRIKDIIVPVSEKVTVFDSVYNNDIVRTASIRKWPNDLFEKVAKQTHSIQCVAVTQGTERKTFAVEDLKTVSTVQLVNLAESPLDVIQLVLKCHQDVKEEGPIENDIQLAPDSQSAPTKLKGYIRTRVKNEATGRFQDLDIPDSDTVSLFDAIYENDALRLAMIRRWPNRYVDMVKCGLAEIKCVLMDDDGAEIRLFSIQELKSVRTNELSGFVEGLQDVYRFLLRCTMKESLTQLEEDNAAGPLASFKPTGFRQRNWTPKDTAPKQLRIRISNQGSKRSKDLLVPVSSSVNMYDAVYCSDSVVAANIRKWPANVIRAVKQQTSEIKVAVLHGDKEMHMFDPEDLKAVSTEQFLDLVPGIDSLVQIELRSQKVPSVYIDELKGQVAVLEAQNENLEGRIQALKSEHHDAVVESQKQTTEHRKSVNSITTELAATVARQALSQIVFDEKKGELENALEEKKKEAEIATSKLAELQSDLKRSNMQNNGMASREFTKLQTQIVGLQQEKERLAKQLENNGLKEELKDLKSKLEDATMREENLKEDLEMYKKRLRQELHGATANESSVKAELRSLKRSVKVELEAAKQKESELKNEIVSYKDKLQQERYMLSCLSTELYDCLYREAELRAEVERMEDDPKHDTLHTEETAVQIINAEYAGVAPDDTLYKDLDSAKNLNVALSKQVIELEAKVKKLEDSNTSKEKEYQQFMDRDEEMKASVTSLTSILEQTTASNKMLTSRVDELESMCARLQKQNEDALKRAELAEEKSKEHSGVFVQVEQLRTRLNHATADKDRLLNLVERKESIIQNLKIDGADVGEQERSKDVLEMLEKSHEREKKLQMQYRVCVSELEKLTETTKAQHESADAKLSEIQKEVEEQKYANKLFKGIIARLNQMNESLEGTTEEQAKELEAIRSKHKELSELGLLDLQNVNRHLSEEVNFLREQKAKFTKTVLKLQIQLEQLAKSRTDGEMERKRLDAVIGEMKAENAQSLARDELFDSMVTKVSKLNRQLKEEQELRKSESKAAKQQQVKLTEQVQSLSSKLDEVKKKLGDPLRSQNTDVLISKVREAEAKNKKLRKERNSLRTELDDVNKRMEQIKRDIGSFGL